MLLLNCSCTVSQKSLTFWFVPTLLLVHRFRCFMVLKNVETFCSWLHVHRIRLIIDLLMCQPKLACDSRIISSEGELWMALKRASR